MIPTVELRNMVSTPQRQSPVHELLSTRQPKWAIVADTPIALRFTSAEAELQAIKTLALCDVSALPKLGVKGPSASAWLSAHHLDVPSAIFETCSLVDGGVIAQLGEDEFLIESGSEPTVVPALRAKLGSATEGTYRVERQDATFLLAGKKAVDVMAQTCGIDFNQATPDRLIMTRVAGASCSVLPQSMSGICTYRLWVDATFAAYLWEQLTLITADLVGTIVGAACFYPAIKEM